MPSVSPLILLGYYQRILLLGIFTQFEQHAERGLRMQEGDVEAFGAFARSLVNQLHTLTFEFGQVFLQAFNSDSQVLDAFAFLFDELTDGAVRLGRFKQFDLGLADLEEPSAL